jgi:hypothetical protein
MEPMLQKALSEFGGKDFAPSEQMQKMMYGFSLERMIKLAENSSIPRRPSAEPRAEQDQKA